MGGKKLLNLLLLFCFIAGFQLICLSFENWFKGPQVQKLASNRAFEESRPSLEQEFSLIKSSEITINLLIKSPGKIKAVATWTGSASNLALILNGPGRTGFYARRDGQSPLTLEFEITQDLLNAGENWRLRIVNFQENRTATGRISVYLPEASSGLKEANVEKTDKGMALVDKKAKIGQQVQVKPKTEGSISKSEQEKFKFAPPQITVLYPNKGEIWEEGHTYTIRWVSQNIQGNLRIEIRWGQPVLEQGKGGILFSFSDVQNTGRFNFTVPALTGDFNANAWIKIESMDGKVHDESDGYFTIRRIAEAQAEVPTITVIYPNGGEVWKPGKEYEIRWTSQNIQEYVSITFYSPDRSEKALIIARVPNTGKHIYRVPKSITKELSYIISISGQSKRDGKWISDESDAPFIVKAAEEEEALLYDQNAFAIEIEGKYLKYGEREVGINLIWADQPAFEWMFYTDSDVGPVEPDLWLGPVGLYNKAIRKFLVYGERRWGINLVWADGKEKDPRDWEISISEFRGKIWLRNLTQKNNRKNPYLVYGIRHSGINLDWGSQPALPNIKIVFPEQAAQQADEEKKYGQTDQALTVYYKDNLDKIVQEGRAHNWLVRKAYEFLKIEDIEEKYVHYGLAFADSPWFGLPDTFSDENPNGAVVSGVRNDLKNKRPVKPKDTLEIKYYYDHYVEKDHRPNLYLGVRYVLSYVIGSARALYAMDNFSHYANDTPIRGDGYRCSDVLVQDKRNGTKGWAIGADKYAINLYKLALRFWPENSLEPDPSLNDLTKIEQHVLLRNTCGTDDSVLDIVLTTFLGGNPFILTEEGKPTWPIWVPDNPDQLSKKLVQTNPPRSKRAAAIYLGWALHMIHDLCMPYHAVNMAGLRHSGWENTVDHFIKEGAYDHLPVWGENKYKYSNKPVYRPFLFFELMDKEERCAAFSDIEFQERLTNIINESRAAYQAIRGNPVSILKHEIHIYKALTGGYFTQNKIRQLEEEIRDAERKALPAFEYLLDIALKETIAMIACLRSRGAGFRGTITDEKGVRLDGATISFMDEEGKVFRTASKQGYYSILLPKLGKYSLVVEHKDYPVFKAKGYYKLNEGGFHVVNINIPKR